MVDRTDVPRANALLLEFNAIEQAIRNIDAGGRITSMVLAPPRNGAGNDNEMPAQVVTTYMEAPPMMYTAIRGFLVERKNEIDRELDNIGVQVNIDSFREPIETVSERESRPSRSYATWVNDPQRSDDDYRESRR